MSTQQKIQDFHCGDPIYLSFAFYQYDESAANNQGAALDLTGGTLYALLKTSKEDADADRALFANFPIVGATFDGQIDGADTVVANLTPGRYWLGIVATDSGGARAFYYEQQVVAKEPVIDAEVPS